MAQRLRPLATKTEQDISVETSVQTVKLLISTGIGCITYLRGLLSDENFEEHRIEAPRLGPAPPPSDVPLTSSQSDDKKKGTQSVKVKRITRGYSGEADKILDWIELGAADALEKGYLHQLVFAIYLDPENPTNVVECYTFTISYEADEHGKKRPEMVVQDQLSGMVISGTSHTGKGTKKPIKEDDAKRQVQRLIKNLITNTSSLDELPRRRFITVRLYYTPETPDDYEPPLFRPFKERSPHLQLTTSQVDEAPELQSLGSLSTGFHGVHLHVTHIAPLLEVSPDVQLSSAEALARNQLDALSRAVVWDAQDLVEQNLLGTSVYALEPVGVRDEKGVVRSLEDVETGKCGEALKEKVGLGESEEKRQILGASEGHREKSMGGDDNAAMVAKAPPTTSHEPELQNTQAEPVVSRAKSTRPPVPFFDETPEEYSLRRSASQDQQGSMSQDGRSQGSSQAQQSDVVVPPPTGLSSVREDDEDDDEVLPEAKPLEEDQTLAPGFPSSSTSSVVVQPDEETQLLFQDTEMDHHPNPSPSFAASSSSVAQTEEDEPMATPKVNPLRPNPSGTAKGTWAKAVGRAKTCECGDEADDEDMVGCSTCSSWKHDAITTAHFRSKHSFHNANDPHIPEDFFCWPCRVVLGVADALLDPAREAEVIRVLDELGDLALFRRALATVWQDGVLNSVELSQRLSVDVATTAQFIKRLTREQFLIEERVESQPKPKARKSRQTTSKAYQKTRVIVNKTPAQEKIKDERYFSPSFGAEFELAKILESGSSSTGSVDKPLARKDPSKLAAETTTTTTDDDPIETSDDEGASSKLPPRHTDQKGKGKATNAPQVYVPHFGRQGPRSGGGGVGGATASSSKADDFHRASSILPNPNAASMDVDADPIDEDEDEEPDTLEDSPWPAPVSHSSGPNLGSKRPSSVPLQEEEEEAGGADSEMEEGRGKKKKRTRGSEVEGPVEVA
ncbi:hypothetical protein RQP46_004939 [Phenoliferia psychrophenolica]